MPIAKGGTLIVGDDVRRFWSKTVAKGTCVLWTGVRDKDGYGKFMTGKAGQQKTHRPHRWLYERVLGAAPPRLLHSCDTPACVALQHLEPGTQSQNIRDSVTRGRHRGHRKLTPEHVAQIRAALAAGERPKEIAARFGISPVTISAIKTGRLWKKI